MVAIVKRARTTVAVLLLLAVLALIERMRPDPTPNTAPGTDPSTASEFGALQASDVETPDAFDPIASGDERVAQTAASEGCDWFDAWAQEKPTLTATDRLIRSMRPLTAERMDCLTADWLLCSALLVCEGAIELTAAERAILQQALPRMAEAFPDAIGPFAFTQLRPETQGCLIETLFDAGFETRSIGRFCAHYLAAAFGTKGSMLEADPAVVEALCRMLVDWPLYDDVWWEGVLEGLPLSEINSALNLRLALYEALAVTLSQAEWIDRLSKLAALEPLDNPGRGLAWMVLGQCLGRHLSMSTFAQLIDRSVDPAWTRTLVQGIPWDLRWPNGGAGPLPETLVNALIELMDSNDYPGSHELAMQQWELYGPAIAASRLQVLVRSSDRSEPGWRMDSATGVYSALDALSKQTTLPADAPYLDQARQRIRDLLVQGDPHDAQQVIDALRYNLQLNARLREVLVEILGPQGIEAFETEQRKWLQPN